MQLLGSNPWTCGTDGDAAHIYSAAKLSAAQNAWGMDALLWGGGSLLGCLVQYGAGSMVSSRCSLRRCWGIVRLSMSSWQRWSSAGLCACSSRTSRSPTRLRTRAVLEYRANGFTETARVRQLALLTSRSLSDVQSQILLMTAEGATTKTIAEDVGYAASTVQALRSASYRQLKIKNKAELVSLLSQVDNV